MNDVLKSVVRSDLSQPISLVILLNEGKYVMQLRDDKPGINAAGQWGIFGGYRKKLEQPEVAASREIMEELSIEVLPRYSFMYLWACVFTADITEVYEKINLQEGQGYGSFSLTELCEMKTAPHAIRILTLFEKQPNSEHPIE